VTKIEKFVQIYNWRQATGDRLQGVNFKYQSPDSWRLTPDA
jgi:hypothetical protein